MILLMKTLLVLFLLSAFVCLLAGAVLLAVAAVIGAVCDGVAWLFVRRDDL